jgi:hypothetical protein
MGIDECKNCVFWQPVPDVDNEKQVAMCRRYPPTAMYFRGRLWSQWVRVDETQWCGEHKREA